MVDYLSYISTCNSAGDEAWSAGNSMAAGSSLLTNTFLRKEMHQFSKQVNPHYVRLFLALELPEAVRVYLGAVQRDLNERVGLYSSLMRWVPAEKFHITLLFLGEQPIEYIGHIQEQLSALFFKPFTISCGPLLLRETKEQLLVWSTITSALVDVLARWAREEFDKYIRNHEQYLFQGHVTLARICRTQKTVCDSIVADMSVKTTLAQTIGEYSIRPVAFEVAHIALIESRQYGTGQSVYYVLSRHGFKENT